MYFCSDSEQPIPASSHSASGYAHIQIQQQSLLDWIDKNTYLIQFNNSNFNTLGVDWNEGTDWSVHLECNLL